MQLQENMKPESGAKHGPTLTVMGDTKEFAPSPTWARGYLVYAFGDGPGRYPWGTFTAKRGNRVFWASSCSMVRVS